MVYSIDRKTYNPFLTYSHYNLFAAEGHTIFINRGNTLAAHLSVITSSITTRRPNESSLLALDSFQNSNSSRTNSLLRFSAAVSILSMQVSTQPIYRRSASRASRNRKLKPGVRDQHTIVSSLRQHVVNNCCNNKEHPFSISFGISIKNEFKIHYQPLIQH